MMSLILRWSGRSGRRRGERSLVSEREQASADDLVKAGAA